ncbi:helix-turn-helix transcriptional regulator [Desulfotruncus alcoholivorax]|uniref:helix-turn-helix transcriptional regulator n=1 Tax=Desulfotruncus alcoholivorax TaxID=265477 RepID=UPI00054F4F51|nr:helix-turn-helix transcriptional regulator [Desulfotruncus alcoholivorax]
MTLAELRGDRHLAAIAEIVGISKSYLSLLENGKRRIFLDIAEKLGLIYGVSIDEILCAYKVCRMSTSCQAEINASALEQPTGTG